MNCLTPLKIKWKIIQNQNRKLTARSLVPQAVATITSQSKSQFWNGIKDLIDVQIGKTKLYRTLHRLFEGNVCRKFVFFFPNLEQWNNAVAHNPLLLKSSMLRAPCFGLQCVERKKNENVVNIPFAYGRWKHLSAHYNLTAATAIEYWYWMHSIHFIWIGLIVHARHSVPFVTFSFHFFFSRLYYPLYNPKPDEEPFNVHIGIEYIRLYWVRSVVHRALCTL